MNEWQYYHIVGEFRQRGHKVTYFNPVTSLGRSGSSEEYSDLLLKEIGQVSIKDRVNIFFTTVGQDSIEADAVQQISQMGIPTVLMCCDDLSVPFMHKRIAKYFDLVWGTSRENQNILKSYGARTIMMPYAANPFLLKPVDVPETSVIGFIGRCYGARAVHIRALANAGVEFWIFGSAPYGISKKNVRSTPLGRALRSYRTVGPYVAQSMLFPIGRRCLLGALKRSLVEYFNDSRFNNNIPETVRYYTGPSFDDMGATFSNIALSLGSMELHSTYVLKKPIMCIHLREFEAPMCGAVHITNRSAEIQDYFEEDTEMLFYETEEELLDKVQFYLHPNRDSLRFKIRRQARRRAENDHTWLKRFERLCNIFGISEV